MKTSNIFLIDDDIEDYLIMKDAFTDMDCPVELQYADCAEKGFKMLERQYAVDGSLPQLIVLDINMPLIDGPGFLRMIRADDRFRNIRVVIYSTAIHPNDEAKCTALGVINCIVKPTNLEDIVAMGKTFIAMCETVITAC